MKYTSLTGLIAAPFTPFNADGSLNLSFIEVQAAALVSHGVSGAFVCGTTGEGLSLTLDERQKVAERWMAVAGPKLRVIVHTGHTCLEDCRMLAAHAQKIGAAAVACLAPCFFKPSGVGDLVEFCAAVAAAAPGLPFYYYHIPSMTGVHFPMLDFLKAAGGRIPNLVGIKFTYENLMDFGQCIGFEQGRFDMLFGRDEILLAGLSLGARGAVGSTYNFAAPLYHRVIEAFDKGNLAVARAEQARACEMIAAFVKYGGLPAGKAMMKMIGLDCGPVRLPLHDLGREEYEALRGELERIGFFKFRAP